MFRTNSASKASQIKWAKKELFWSLIYEVCTHKIGLGICVCPFLSIHWDLFCFFKLLDLEMCVHSQKIWPKCTYNFGGIGEIGNNDGKVFIRLKESILYIYHSIIFYYLYFPYCLLCVKSLQWAGLCCQADTGAHIDYIHLRSLEI